MATYRIAKPDPESVKKIAECKVCGEVIEALARGTSWFHSYTGSIDCAPQLPPRPASVEEE